MSNVIRKSYRVLDRDIVYYDVGDVTAENSLYIQGHLHSNEVNGFLTLMELVKMLKGKRLRRGLRIVPCSNPFGFEQYMNGSDGRYSQTEGYNWNRIFPTKNSDGSGGNLERSLVSALTELSLGFSQIIDVHTPENGLEHIYTSELDSRLMHFDDIPYVLTDSSDSGAFEDYQSFVRGLPSCTLELPSASLWTQENTRYWAKRLMMECEALPEGENRVLPRLYGRMKNLNSTISGAWLLLAEPGSFVDKGQPVVKIVSTTDEQILSFSRRTFLLCFRKRGIISSGNWIVRGLEIKEDN